MLELFIRDKKVDLPNDYSSAIAFTYERVNYNNPAIVKNSFTKSITIPGTNNNNKIFNEIYRFDRVQNAMHFNPSKRVDFVITNNGNYYESGYMKLDKVSNKNGVISYSITLFGNLGGMLYKLSYKDIDGDVPINLADLTFSEDLDFTINKRTVRDAWNWLDTDKRESADAKWGIINFMCAYNGYPKAKNFNAKNVYFDQHRFYKNKNGSKYNAVGTYTYNDMSNVPIVSEDDPTPATPINAEVKKTYFPATQAGAEVFDRYIDDGSGTGYVFVQNPDREMTEWETFDLRSYLLRPVIRLKSIFEAAAEYVGYEFIYEGNLFNGDVFNNSWITLNMLDEIDENVETNTTFTKEQLLSLTSTPASYIVSFCKTYGIYIDVDDFSKKCYFRQYRSFYNGETENLIVDKDSKIDISPLSFDSNKYKFSTDNVDSEYIKQYEETYGAKYGSYTIHTGYEFNSSEKDYITNSIFKTAPLTLETSEFFYQPKSATGVEGLSVSEKTFLPNIVNGSRWMRYIMKPTSATSKDFVTFSILGVPDGEYDGFFGPNINWRQIGKDRFDTFPKLQLHGENNQRADGSNVLTIFTRFITPVIAVKEKDAALAPRSGNVPYLLSDDICLTTDPNRPNECRSMTIMDGKHCWISTKNYASIDDADADADMKPAYLINSLPMFDRMKWNVSGRDLDIHISETLDFGLTKELNIYGAKYDNSAGSTYSSIWDAYISDMYNVNTRIIECKAHISSIYNAFRKFYWYDNSYWILMSLSDYNGAYMSKCKFIKVNDPTNYNPGFIPPTPPTPPVPPPPPPVQNVTLTVECSEPEDAQITFRIV